MLVYDATSSGTALPGNSITFSHTCSGSNRILLVFISQNSGGSSDIITGVTYNGVSMTRIDRSNTGVGITVYAYYLVNPTAGANNVVVSASSGSDYLRAIAVSYTGALQTGQPEGSAKNNNGSTTSLTTTYTTTTDKSWCVSFVANDGALAMTNSTNVTTVRNNVSTITYLGDSDGDISPAGAYNMTWTCSSQGVAAIQVAIKDDGLLDSGNYFLMF